MKAQINSIFPNNNCIHTTNSSEIRLKEIDKITHIIYNEDEKEHFKIENEAKTEINILIVDGCLKFNPEQRKCDFAFWVINSFYFVEIKAIKIKNRKKHKKDIIEQLEETIKYFTNNTIDFGNRIIYAIGGWAYYPSKPLISTTMQNHSFRFQKSYNTILLEGNNITIKD